MRYSTKIVMLLIVTILMSPVAFGYDYDYVDGYGVIYKSSSNKHGVILKSARTTIYLGKSCDAFSAQYGWGTWGWANGGVRVEMKKKIIGFPRQNSPFYDDRCGF